MKTLLKHSAIYCLLLLPSLTLGQLVAPATQSTTGNSTTNPVNTEHGTRVLVISIDGCRPDVALRANMPNFRKLLATGSFSMYARTTDVAITLPSHTSMITGVTPIRHTITWNDDVDEKTFHYPAYPTLMELAHNAGLSTALVTAKSKFVALTRPGTIDWVAIPAVGKATKADVTANAAKTIIESHKPNVMMLHFGDPDAAGHSIGWGTPEQITALEDVDRGLGVVFDAMKAAGVYDTTLIIVSADHGGFARTHGANDLRAAFIPWIAVGPNVRKGYDLTRIKEVAIRTEDTFATAAEFLNLKVADDIDGKPIAQIWKREELMEDAPKRKASTRASTRPTNTAK